MTQLIAKIKYSEVNAGEKPAELASKNTTKRHQLNTHSSWSTTFSENKMKIICTGVVLVFIVASSIMFLISSESSWTKKTVVENEPKDAMLFDNSKEEKEVQEFMSSNHDNTDDRLPKLRSLTQHNRRQVPDDIGHMSVYIKKCNRKPYERLEFPAARYNHRRIPLRGPFLTFMPRVPIVADRLTKQTLCYSKSDVYILPPLIDAHGQLFSVAELIASGDASLISSRMPLHEHIDMLRYFKSTPLNNPGVPRINPFTGDFNGGIHSNFASFPSFGYHGARPNIDNTWGIGKNEEHDNDDGQENEENNYPRPCNSYRTKKRTYKTKRPTRTTPLKTLQTLSSTKTTLLSVGVTVSSTTTTLLPINASSPQCRSKEPSRTPFNLNLFQDEFKNPSVIDPLLKECRPDGHCMFSYTIDVFDTRLSPFNLLIPECASKPGTIFMTYGGHVPGPTLIVPTGHESIVRFNNKIGTFFKESFSPCIGNRVGRPIGIHHHGSASAPPFDGWAEDETCFNETKEYVYPNNRPALDWYHDHALHITADNAYYGLAGLYVVSSKKIHGGCGEPWNLENIEDRLLIFQDKALDSECQLAIDKEDVDKINFYGDINMVSGIPFPLMNLEAKWYRFRMLNAAVSRPYLLKIKNAALQDIGQQICKVIATDGGYRATTVTFPTAGLLIGVAERYEIVCDFTTFKGQTLYMWNDFDDDWMKDVPYFCYSNYIAKLQILSTTPTSSPEFNEQLTNPQPERPIARVLDASDIATAVRMAANGDFHRRMVFGRSNDQWVINGETWDSFKIAADDIGQNTWELWKFQTGGGWFHPVHVHLVDFYIIRRDRDGGLKTYENMSPKDIIYLGPSQKVWVIIRFGPHKGDYMFHCHNLIHEDDDMMRAFRIIDTEKGRTPSTAQPFVLNGFAKIVYSNWKYIDPMLTDTAAKPTSLMPTFDSAYVQNMLEINIYRIFYPRNETDIPLHGFTNPWKSTWCPV
ncbi:hypothetical protein I4U23_004634 [Adineta vaga]|nr:hypothetical protein I4U23_004634 [Adineta vaga]